MKNYNHYYKTEQVKFPTSTLQKCGFSCQRVYRVQFDKPSKKRGNFLLAKSRITQDYHIVKQGKNWVVYETDGIYKAIWLEGCEPTDRYGDFTLFVNL
jgi:hypothetical protein